MEVAFDKPNYGMKSRIAVVKAFRFIGGGPPKERIAN